MHELLGIRIAEMKEGICNLIVLRLFLMKIEDEYKKTLMLINKPGHHPFDSLEEKVAYYSGLLRFIYEHARFSIDVIEQLQKEQIITIDSSLQELLDRVKNIYKHLKGAFVEE